MTPTPITAPKTQKSFPLKKVVASVVLIALVAAGSAAYHIHSTNTKKEQAFQADKARFAAVERDMATAYDRMIKASSKQIPLDKTKSCSRTALKFEAGQLSCGIAYHLQFSVDDIRQHKAILMTMLSSLVSTSGFKLSSNGSKVDDIDVDISVQKVRHFSVLGPDGFDCEFSFTHERTSQTETSKIEKYAANDFFLCNKDVVIPIYPLAE